MIVVDKGGECDCTSADEFLDKLSPRHRFWGGASSDWIFRGMDGDFDLLPKAYRDDGKKFEEYGIQLISTLPAHSKFQWGLTHLLKDFQRRIDRAGLTIPPPTPDLFEGFKESLDMYQQMMRLGSLSLQSIPLLALAQHFGLPTPLLDWTTRPYIAAYFALPGREPKAEKIVVWAMKHGCLAPPMALMETPELPDYTKPADMTIETAPRASNPNLHAQSGLFTYIQGDGAYRLTVDAYMESFANPKPEFLNENLYPLMRKLTLPSVCGPRLRRLLGEEGIDGASMFPGYDGVVRAMKERLLAE